MRLSTAFTAAALVSLLAASAAHGGHYADTVRSFNPTHFYRLDETQQGQVTDAGTGSLIHGTHEGAFPPGQVGVDGVPLPGFDANNRSMLHGNAAGVNLGSGTAFAADVMTIAMWVRTASGDNGIGDRVFTNNVVRNEGGTEDSFQITLPAGGNAWGIAVATGNGDPPLNHQLAVRTSDVNFQDNTWRHLVVVRNGDDVNNLRVVIDGVDYSSRLEPTTAGWGTTGTNAHIGVRADDGASGHNFNGNIDDTAIWLNRALTVPEAIAIYQSSFIPEPTGLSILALAGAFVLRRRRRWPERPLV
jgi:Concanavalin A-like lectin/glucanases superfamily